MSIRQQMLMQYGVPFRSDTELLWSQQFTSIGVEWEYEPTNYNVGVWYRPDYYLPGLDIIVETVGSYKVVDVNLIHPDHGVNRLLLLAKHLERKERLTQVFVLCGIPRDGRYVCLRATPTRLIWEKEGASAFLGQDVPKPKVDCWPRYVPKVLRHD